MKSELYIIELVWDWNKAVYTEFVDVAGSGANQERT